MYADEHGRSQAHRRIEPLGSWDFNVINRLTRPLILTLSVTQLVQVLTEARLWTWLLSAAWVLLVVGIIAGVLRRRQCWVVNGYRAGFEAKILELRNKHYEGLAAEDLAAEELWAELKALTALRETAFYVLGYIKSWSLVLALVSLILFAVRYVPF